MLKLFNDCFFRPVERAGYQRYFKKCEMRTDAEISYMFRYCLFAVQQNGLPPSRIAHALR